MKTKDRLQRIGSLWHQYNEAKALHPQVADDLFRALDKTINPEHYKNPEPYHFKIGDRISVSWTVCKSILHGKRRLQRETRTAEGTVVADLPGDEKYIKDGRIRIEFDEMEQSYCPLCLHKAGGRYGFRCHPDDLRKIKNCINS